MKNESKTLFIPLYGKAMMSREGFIADRTAERIVAECGFDFGLVDRSRKLAIYMTMRALQFDRYAREFAKAHPDGVIIQLGVGMDSRIQRVPCTNKWWDLDFPEVIALRKQYFPENERYRLLAAPALPADWLAQIPEGGHALVLAEGLSMYLSEADVRSLMDALQRHFDETLFVLDAYSRLAAKLSPLKNPVNAVRARIDFAMDDPQLLAEGREGVRCVLNEDIITREYTEQLKGKDRLRFRWMGRAGRNLYRIFGYQLNKQ
jgi:O-methyltransferase involved in polyketide biosynthesis